jgi:hypothetical protein
MENRIRRAQLIKKAQRNAGTKPAPSKLSQEITDHVTSPSSATTNISDALDDRNNIDVFVESLQKKLENNVVDIKATDDKDYVKVALIEAEQIWLNVQVLMKSDLYANMDDKDKINLIQRDFAEFYKNFPVVARYMICMGQYKMVAFKRMLYNSEETAPRSVDKNASKDANEKLWIKRQADYVRFLWEEYQEVSYKTKPEFNTSSDGIWKQAHTALTDEFKQFRDLHESMKQKIKEDKLVSKKEILYEMGNRIISGQQNLNEDATKTLISKLQTKLFLQRYKKVIAQIETIMLIEPTSIGEGINEDAKNEYDSDLQQAYYKKTYTKMDMESISV